RRARPPPPPLPLERRRARAGRVAPPHRGALVPREDGRRPPARPPLRLPEPHLQPVAEGQGEAGGRRLHAHRGPRRPSRLPAPAAPEALAPDPRPRLLRCRLLREGGLPPRRRRPAALLGGDDVAGG